MEGALIADAGGTNIRIAIVNKQAEILHLKYYKCKDYNTIGSALKQYLSEVNANPKIAVIAVAATIVNDYVAMTNHSWEFSVSDLKKEMGFSDLQIINDFEAQAMVVEHLRAEDVKVIYNETSTDFSTYFSTQDRRVIAGPGTGFGNAFLYKKEGWNILPTEAGHCIVGSYTDLEHEVFENVKKQNKKIKETFGELFVSGGGILRIYNALCDINGVNKKYQNSPDIPLNMKSDALCKQTMEVFYSLLGTMLGNIALSYLPYGGIYLTGGVIPKTLNDEMEYLLINRFLDRSLTTVKTLLQRVPIHVIKIGDPAMLGLAKHVSFML